VDVKKSKIIIKKSSKFIMYEEGERERKYLLVFKLYTYVLFSNVKPAKNILLAKKRCVFRVSFFKRIEKEKQRNILY